MEHVNSLHFLNIIADGSFDDICRWNGQIEGAPAQSVELTTLRIAMFDSSPLYHFRVPGDTKFNTHVTLKDRKSSLSEKTDHNELWH